jgi:branched-chain amino acid transport system permease protein
MSASAWRRAMASGASAAQTGAGGAYARGARGVAGATVVGTAPARTGVPNGSAASHWLDIIRASVGPRHVIGIAFILAFPFIATPFFTFQVAAQALVLGTIALSLTFLGGYGGMLSLAQMTVAGIAGYAVALLGNSSSAEISLGWPWWAALPVALVVCTLAATLIGWLSVRTEGIYTIMITLAIGVAFYYLVLQNYSVFNGFQGLREVYPSRVLGIAWRDPVPFYFLSAAVALASYFFVRWVVRTPFGIALQGIRDNPRRMNALGFNVVAHRVAAYALAGVIAALGGILFVWYNGLISPGSVSTSWLINILVIAVLGGMKHPLGAFIGAIVFVLLQTFAIDVIDRERFNLVIGGVFLAIVLFSPDGLLGLWAQLRSRFNRNQPPSHHHNHQRRLK